MKHISRRSMLGTLGALPFLGAGSPVSAATISAGGRQTDPAALVTEADRHEYVRLKTLDLVDPAAAAKRKRMPVGKIGSLQIGRLVSGSNLISLNMHARDLSYVRSLAAGYNTEERVFMTLKKSEEHGINTIVLKNHNFRQFRLSEYEREWGGKLQWIADVITTDINQYEALLEEHLSLGAAAAYLWGGASDTWFHHKQPGKIIRAFEIMRRYKIPVGICAHRLEPIMFCEKEGLQPDFYMKTLHHDRYWSAHPKENRRFMEMYEQNSPSHSEYHDNLFCSDHEATVEFMQDVKVPWIAFKVLAAGAIPPEDGFRFAFESGADFICVGMFDFQVAHDAEIARKAILAAHKRKRPWCG
jgi:hypothetical protein